MARLAVTAVFGFLVGVTLGAALGVHADEPSDEIQAVAEEAGLEDITPLMGALNSQPGVDARQYLIFDGLLKAPKPVLSGRLACIAWVESRNDPNATNRRSGAGGLFQFLLSTWLTTPQGKAGYSRYDPVAATEAAEWMVRAGRINEWVAVSGGYC